MFLAGGGEAEAVSEPIHAQGATPHPYLRKLQRFVRYRVLRRSLLPEDIRTELLSPEIRELAVRDAARVAGRFLTDFYGEKHEDQGEEVLGITRDFFGLYPERPVPSNSGGSGFGNLFWLYLMGRLRQPDLIVESGVWQGQSSWILRRACPMAEFHAFDIDLSRLVYRDESIEFHEHDWAQFDFGDVRDRNTLVFFDDHVDQMRRLEESRERGFRTLLVDDNLPVYHIFRELGGIVPTVDMLFDDALEDGQEIAWLHRNRRHACRVDRAAWNRARATVGRYENFPLIDHDADTAATKARYGGPTKLALVTLL